MHTHIYNIHIQVYTYIRTVPVAPHELGHTPFWHSNEAANRWMQICWWRHCTTSYLVEVKSKIANVSVDLCVSVYLCVSAYLCVIAAFIWTLTHVWVRVHVCACSCASVRKFVFAAWVCMYLDNWRNIPSRRADLYRVWDTHRPSARSMWWCCSSRLDKVPLERDLRTKECKLLFYIKKHTKEQPHLKGGKVGCIFDIIRALVCAHVLDYEMCFECLPSARVPFDPKQISSDPESQGKPAMFITAGVSDCAVRLPVLLTSKVDWVTTPFAPVIFTGHNWRSAQYRGVDALLRMTLKKKKK